MNLKRILLVGVFVAVQFFAGCANSGGGPTGPSNAPTLTRVTVTPSAAHSGAIIVFSIDFVDPDGDLNGGSAVITDNQSSSPYNNNGVSNADGTAGTLTLSIELSPLASQGELVFNIYVVDRAGNPSNIIAATLAVI